RGERAVQAGDVVADVGRAAHRLPVRFAVARHETGFGLDDGIVARPVVPGAPLAEAAYRDVHDIRLHAAHVGVAHAPARQRARAEVFNHGVRARGQLEEDLAPFGTAQVEREAALVAVDGRVEIADPARDERRQAAGDLALRLLDLDHVGA